MKCFFSWVFSFFLFPLSLSLFRWIFVYFAVVSVLLRYFTNEKSPTHAPNSHKEQTRQQKHWRMLPFVHHKEFLLSDGFAFQCAWSFCVYSKLYDLFLIAFFLLKTFPPPLLPFIPLSRYKWQRFTATSNLQHYSIIWISFGWFWLLCVRCHLISNMKCLSPRTTFLFERLQSERSIRDDRRKGRIKQLILI